MFGFFSKKKKKQRNVGAGRGAEQPMSPDDIFQAMDKIQKDLDKLKSVAASSIGKPLELNSAESIVEKAMDEVNKRDLTIQRSGTEKIIEGVFDGENMVGADGQQYDVPANYASKSKLVEGDIMKLTINNIGAFIYKQIKPIERSRRVGILEQDQQNMQFFAVADGKKWRLLTASVTYFKGEAGDEVIFLVPENGISKWAAVENIIKS